MRILFIALFLFVIDWFAFQAVWPLIGNAPASLQTLVTGFYWAIPVFFVYYLYMFFRGRIARWPKKVTMILTAMMLILYLSKLVMGLVIVADDIRRGIVWLAASIVPEVGGSVARSTFMSNLGLVLGLIPFVSLTYGLIRNPYRYKIFRKDIDLADLPEALDGLRIVQISDIHAGSLISKARVQKSVEMINALNPDLVFFTGDLVNNLADEADDFIDVFREIRSKYGIYSITGNHDYGDYMHWPNAEAKRANFENLKQQHRRLGWDLLLNAHRVVNIQGKQVAVIGVENYSAHPRFSKYGDMSVATNGLGPVDLTILLSHDPSHWDDEIVTRYPNVDLTLSGHTHGFQFGIELNDTFKWSPVQYMYKRWAGLYKQGNQYLYINRGLGFLGYPGRVGILPEITLLTVKRGTEK